MWSWNEGGLGDVNLLGLWPAHAAGYDRPELPIDSQKMGARRHFFQHIEVRPRIGILRTGENDGLHDARIEIWSLCRENLIRDATKKTRRRGVRGRLCRSN